jgi:hypothetical protein
VAAVAVPLHVHVHVHVPALQPTSEQHRQVVRDGALVDVDIEEVGEVRLVKIVERLAKRHEQLLAARMLIGRHRGIIFSRTPWACHIGRVSRRASDQHGASG